MTGITGLGAEAAFALGTTLLLDPGLRVIIHLDRISKDKNKLAED